MDTILLLRQLIFCTYPLFGTLKFNTVMAEWLSRWISDQTVVGSTPITDDFSVPDMLFFF